MLVSPIASEASGPSGSSKVGILRPFLFAADKLIVNAVVNAIAWERRQVTSAAWGTFTPLCRLVLLSNRHVLKISTARATAARVATELFHPPTYESSFSRQEDGSRTARAEEGTECLAQAFRRSLVATLPHFPAILSRRRRLTAPQYLDKRLFVQLNGSRKVIGVLRGYDVSPFLPDSPDAPTAADEPA